MRGGRRGGRSFGLRGGGGAFDACDHFADLGEVTGAHVRARQQVLDQGGDVAVEQALGQLTDHRVLQLFFGNRGAAVVLAGLGGGPPGEYTTALVERQTGGEGVSCWHVNQVE